ncbi:MAG: TlpA disulfide reductase family protein [Planctomycetota bacterium]
MRTLVRFVPALLAVCVLGLAVPRVVAQDEGPDEDEMKLLEGCYQEGREATQAKDFPKAVAAFEKFFPRLAKTQSLPAEVKKKVERDARYDYACGLAQTGKKADALKAFVRAIELGYWEWKHIDEDKELDSIRKEDDFKKAVEKGKVAEKEHEEQEKKDYAARTTEALGKDALFTFDFEVKTLDGQDLKLSSLKGKVVIVDVWGTWCPPCRAEIPHFVKLYETYKAQGLEIVGLAFEGENPDPTGTVKTFAEKNGIKYPLACLDESSPVLKSIPEFGAFPTTIFVDREGKVRLKEVGARGPGALEGITKTLLDAKKADAGKK